MASCKFCLTETVDSWFGNWCERCHRLQRTIHLFGVEKVCSIVDKVLIVDEEKHQEKINVEIAKELYSKEISLKKKKKNKDKESQINSNEIKEV